MDCGVDYYSLFWPSAGGVDLGELLRALMDWVAEVWGCIVEGRGRHETETIEYLRFRRCGAVAFKTSGVQARKGFSADVSQDVWRIARLTRWRTRECAVILWPTRSGQRKLHFPHHLRRNATSAQCCSAYVSVTWARLHKTDFRPGRTHLATTVDGLASAAVVPEIPPADRPANRGRGGVVPVRGDTTHLRHRMV